MWLIFIFIIYINYELNKLYKQKYMERNNANINNVNTNLSDYTLDELFSLFDIQIKKETTYETLTEEINQKSDVMIKMFEDKNPDLSIFFKKAKNFLLKNNLTNDSYKKTSNDVSAFVIEANLEHDNDYLFKKFNSSGNPINRKTISKLFNIDSRFRKNMDEPTYNFSIELQNPQYNVIEMKLCDLELPTTYYPISTTLNNNYMWVKAYVGITGQTIYNYIYIPDGNYYFDNLINYINGPESLKSPQLARTPMSIFFDLNYNNAGGVGTGTGKVEFGIFTEEDISLNNYVETGIEYIELNFGGLAIPGVTKTISFSSLQEIIDIYGKDYYTFTPPITEKEKLTEQVNKQKTFGWMLGYRERIYTNNLYYISESIMDIIGPRYLYLRINDGISSSVNSNFFAASGSGISSDTIARISLKGAAFNIQAQNDFSVYTEPRLYFGPVNITTFKISIVDEYERFVDLNGSDISFTLRLTVIYTN